MIEKLFRWFPPLKWVYKFVFTPRLFNFHQTRGYIVSYQFVTIVGRLGGYKTSLAMMIGHELLEHGYAEYFYSNVRTAWGDDIEVLPDVTDPRKVNAVVLFDEGGQFLKGQSDIEAVMAALRKMQIKTIVPTAEPPASRLMALTIEPMYIFTDIGIPLVIYRTWLKARRARDDRFTWFWFWCPSAAFGLYDTLDFNKDGMGIDFAIEDLLDKLSSQVPETSRYYARQQAKNARRNRGRVPVSKSGSEDQGAAVAALMDQIGEQLAEFQDAAGRIPDLEVNRAKRSRFG